MKLAANMMLAVLAKGANFMCKRHDHAVGLKSRDDYGAAVQGLRSAIVLSAQVPA